MNLDAEAADMAAALMVLRGLHLSDITDQPIDVQTKDDLTGKRVVAVADIEANMLTLPPCVPKSAKLSKDSQSIARVPIRVTRQYTDPPITTTYYVTPEWKMPKDKAGEDAPTSVWEFSGDETLHPFCAVLRLAPQELARKVGAGERCEFNMVSSTIGTCWLAWGRRGSWVCARKIRAGGELILETVPKRQAAKREKSWKDDVSLRARAKAKTAAAPPPKAPAPSMYEVL